MIDFVTAHERLGIKSNEQNWFYRIVSTSVVFGLVLLLVIVL